MDRVIRRFSCALRQLRGHLSSEVLWIPIMIGSQRDMYVARSMHDPRWLWGSKLWPCCRVKENEGKLVFSRRWAVTCDDPLILTAWGYG
jgi:hypothetical protein